MHTKRITFLSSEAIKAFKDRIKLLIISIDICIFRDSGIVAHSSALTTLIWPMSSLYLDSVARNKTIKEDESTYTYI